MLLSVCKAVVNVFKTLCMSDEDNVSRLGNISMPSFGIYTWIL